MMIMVLKTMMLMMMLMMTSTTSEYYDFCDYGDDGCYVHVSYVSYDFMVMIILMADHFNILYIYMYMIPVRPPPPFPMVGTPSAPLWCGSGFLGVPPLPLVVWYGSGLGLLGLR